MKCRLSLRFDAPPTPLVRQMYPQVLNPQPSPLYSAQGLEFTNIFGLSLLQPKIRK